MHKINIAIDGYSSCGKSTLAKQMAEKLGYAYVDSGAMYRAVALYGLRMGMVKGNELDREALVAALDKIDIDFKSFPNGARRVFLNGEDVEEEIRSMQVSKVVSLVSTVPEVRARLVELQQQLGKNKGVVMDGRDIGTVVFPDAGLKIFMKADTAIRAQRRFDELIAKGIDVSLEEVVGNIKQRDHQDENREHDPLRLAEDAIILDNSHLSPKEQFEQAMKMVNERIVR